EVSGVREEDPHGTMGRGRRDRRSRGISGIAIVVVRDRQLALRRRGMDRAVNGRAEPVGTNTRAHVTPIAALVAVAGAALLAQGIARDDGHCATPTSIVVACWNGSAGNGIAENIANYPEFLPNLHGWDFRINLPHVRF